MSQKTTCLLECTYWYVPVHTSTYDCEILVLPYTVLYRYVLRSGTYQYVLICPILSSCTGFQMWESRQDTMQAALAAGGAQATSPADIALRARPVSSGQLLCCR
jgi:hypothetical protein